MLRGDRKQPRGRKIFALFADFFFTIKVIICAMLMLMIQVSQTAALLLRCVCWAEKLLYFPFSHSKVNTRLEFLLRKPKIKWESLDLMNETSFAHFESLFSVTYGEWKFQTFSSCYCLLKLLNNGYFEFILDGLAHNCVSWVPIV